MLFRAVLVFFALTAAVEEAAAQSLLRLDNRIPLGAVSGRIDHLAIDLARGHLFVAELGNDTVGVIDLATGKKIASINDVDEPQGVAFVPWTDEVYVASGGGDGVTVVDAARLVSASQIKIGSDCDNVRVNAQAREVMIGCGDGLLAVVDPVKRAVVRRITLQAHPESFQLDTAANKVFVNLADRGEVIRADLASGGIEAVWKPTNYTANFAMARDADAGLVWTIFRKPSRLVSVSERDGTVAADFPICQDADDLFIDRKRGRIYVTCGQGLIDVLVMSNTTLVRRGLVQTVRGARTSLFVPERDALYVAVRAADGNSAAVWVFQPVD